MGFSLNQSLSHIEVKEPHVAEIYRSSNNVVPSEEQCQGHLCEAYVCTAREEDAFTAYVAFFDTVTQRPVVFSAASDTRKPADQKRLVNEALKFTKSMGFDMEQVKLDYSAAMRQVIIRGISVMRPPAPPRPGRQQARGAAPSMAPQPAVQLIPAPAPHDHTPAIPSVPNVPSPAVAALTAEIADLRKALADKEPAEAETGKVPSPEAAALAAEVAGLKEALAGMEAAKAEAERMAEQAITAIKLELERTTASHREQEEALREELAEKNTGASPENDAVAGLRDELQGKAEALRALEGILARESAQRREAEARAEELDRRLEQAETESAELRRELDRLHQDVAAERSSAEQQLSREIAGRAAEELAATEREQALRDELAAARTENGVMQGTLKNVMKEQQVLINEREALKAELAVIKESAGIAWRQEREALEQERTGLHASVKRLEEGQREERQRSETLLADKELELKGTQAELNSLAAKLEQLTGEKKVWDTLAGNFKKKAHKAVERLKREKQALEEKLKELEHAPPSLAVSPPPPPAPSVYPLPASQAPIAMERHVESPFAALGLVDAGPGFSGFGGFGGPSVGGGGATFRYAPDVTVISYHVADDIVELYGSANVVQAAPEGRRSQLCGAYVCVVEREGKTTINLAWHLIDSGEVLICLPEEQPEGAANYARALQDAIFYFESVGFMMDRFELSRNSHRQIRALEKIGICRMDEPVAGEQGAGKENGDGGAIPAAA
ncbi:hypothetical protein FO488_03955 [Geobacter sp. FeAm09]|uniref:hypothetical protein n=1 Tax=Geobacter sp. FeAm09 TaxID=2597769 RepID=UPI0011EE4B47|nr:hypothetical protein [Geobacter sp. FeAm09]QEM67386.1 hypothetical protein FO488_03955 [Geobacter sp. FeAm09]